MSEPNTGQDREEAKPDQRPWFKRWHKSWSTLFKAIGISLLVHLVVALIIAANPSLPFDIDMGWEGRMAELSGIGHGAEDYDPHRESDWDEMEPMRQAPAEEADDEPAEEPEPADEEEAADEEATEEETSDEEADRDEARDEGDDDDEIAAEDVDDGPGNEPEPAEASDEASDDDANDAADDEGDDVPSPRPAAEVVAEGIPGIDRSGPSNLPDMREYGPGNARVTVLFRTDRMRDTELGRQVSRLLKEVPDYRIALDGTDLDPVAELDSIFMASANPEDLHSTFLAARHSFDDVELMSILDTRHGDRIDWEQDGSEDDAPPMRPLVPSSSRYRDPRRLMLAKPGLMVMGKPHWFQELMEPVDPDSPLGQELADADGGPSLFSLLDGLAQIEAVAERDDALLLFSAYGVSFRQAPILDQIPPIQGLRLGVHNLEAPKLTIDLHMRSASGAAEMVEKCPDLKGQARFLARIFNVTALVAPLECRQDDDYVIIEGQYTTQDLIAILQRAPQMMDAVTPRALRGLPAAEQPEANGDGDGDGDGADSPQP